jgi:hypothetical protein
MASGKFLPLALAGSCFPRGLRDQTWREDSVILEEVSLFHKVTENLLGAEKKMTRGVDYGGWESPTLDSAEILGFSRGSSGHLPLAEPLRRVE